MHGFLVDNYAGVNYHVGQLPGGQLSGSSCPEGHYLEGTIIRGNCSRTNIG